MTIFLFSPLNKCCLDLFAAQKYLSLLGADIIDMYTAANEQYFDTGLFLPDTVSETETQCIVVLERLYVRICIETGNELFCLSTDGELLLLLKNSCDKCEVLLRNKMNAKS